MDMKKVILLLAVIAAPMIVSACTRCEVEPIVEENHKLIVPPNFGSMPK